MGPTERGVPGDEPRTDLPPRKLPYDEDYFGTGDEEGVVREREASGDEEEGEGPKAA
jgi:hypothetical protein